MTGPRRVLVAVLLLLAQVVDTTVLSQWNWAGTSASITLLVVVAFAIDAGAVRGASLGIVAGLLSDLAPPSAGLLGLTAISFGVAGAVAGRWRRVDEQSVLLVLAAAVSAALTAAAIQAVLALVTTDLSLSDAAAQAGASTVLTVAAALLVLPAVLLLDRWVVGQPHEVVVRL